MELGSSVVTLLIGHLHKSGYMARLVVMNEHQKYMWHQEIGPCAHKIMGSTIITNGRAYVTIEKE